MTTNSESSSKINLSSRWTVFEILPTSAVIWIQKFSMKTRLRDISKTTNATNWTKTILESLYKVLLLTYNLTALKWLVFLLRALEFYTTKTF